MKKILTLMVVWTAMAITTFAQWNGNSNRNDHHDNDNRGYGNGNYNNGNYNNDNRYYNFRTESELLRNMNLTRQQERRIARINDEYSDKSFRIQNSRFISPQQKRFQLERLEQQRKQEIMNLLSGFQRERYNTWCSRNGNGTYGNGRW